MENKKKILVPIGFSQYTQSLTDYAGQFCKRINGELHILHGIEIPQFMQAIYPEINEDKVLQELEIKLIEVQSRIESKFDISVVSAVKSGRIYESILDYQKEHQVDWLVIGANGSESNKDFIGANTLRVLRESYCPTISLKGDCKKEEFQQVVVPLDLTTEVDEKIRRMSLLSKLIPGLTFRLVGVTTSKDEFAINRMTRHLGHIKKAIAEDGIQVSSEIIAGVDSKSQVAESILDYTRKIKGDILFIMTQKEYQPVKYFIGSIAQQLINQEEFPVLSITP